MAKNLKTNRDYDEIVDELFLDHNSAIDKYRKARRTLYELDINETYHRPLERIPTEAWKFFNYGFYQHSRGKNEKEKYDYAVERLRHAVGKEPGNDKSCHTRCMKLLKELNKCMVEEGLEEVPDNELLLDWLTFDYVVSKDKYGLYEQDKEYGFYKRYWNDLNLVEFKEQLRANRKKGIHQSLQDIYKNIQYTRSLRFLD